MVSAEPLVPVAKLRIKFGSMDAHKSFQRPLVINECGYKKFASDSVRSTKGEMFNADNSSKRGPEELSEDQPKKKQKMDRNMSRQCSMLLRSLMDHRYGWLFNQPVDPVRLNIPDYFSVISKPMDLGTIKSKLAKNVYICLEEFAADVRLTFSNAMLYNPPSNEVHQIAKTLNDVFEGRWRSFEKKRNPEGSKVGAATDFSGETGEFGDTSHIRPEKPALSEISGVKKLKLLEEKVNKVSLAMRPEAATAKVKLTKQDFSHTAINLAGKSSCRGTNNGGRHDCGSDGANRPLISTISNLITSSNSTLTCSSDITWEKPSRDSGSDASSITDCRAKIISVSQITKSDPDSDGAVSSMDDDNACPSFQSRVPKIDAACGEGLETPVFDVQTSPKKALRAAMLKRRFADTILKAKQRTLLDRSYIKGDPVKMQQEKERLEKKHREEKARIEAEIRAAEAATRMREEIEQKTQRERERVAARLALQKMEETVEIVENLEVEKELVMLCGSDNMKQAFIGRAQLLEKLGLFMKDDDNLADEIEDKILSEDGEEGEIFS